MHKWQGDLAMPQLWGPGGYWYAGELVPRGCVPNALPIDDGLGDPLFQDVQHLWEELRGLLAEEQAEEGGVAEAEEDEEEEKRTSAAGETAPV